MKIEYHQVFKNHFKKRILPYPKLTNKFKERVSLFIKNSQHALLKNHKLIGKKREYWSFSITGDIRVIYKIINNTLRLYDIGSHNQVY